MNEMALPRRVHFLSNAKSGRGAGANLSEIAANVCRELDVELVLHTIESPDDLDREAERAIEAALVDGGTVIAAGGDGTIRSVAQHAQGRDVRFGVIPCGTFNFFARTHNLPDDNETAFRLAISGRPTPVRLGEINGRIFLVNASLGLYAKAIRERERRTDRFGRHRIVVMISTILSLLSRHRLLHVEMTVSGKPPSRMRTPMIFIGNNALQLRDLSLNVARCMKQDLLAVVTMQPVSRFKVLRIVARGIAHTLEKEDAVESFCVDALTIETKRKHQSVALDGEVFQMTSPLRVRSLPETLILMKNHASEGP